MKRLLEYLLKDGNLVLVEVEEPERPSTAAVRGVQFPSHEVVERATQTFEDALEKIKPAAGVILAKLKELKSPPEQIALEFGIKFSAKAGAVIASADTEANFKVTLTWKRES
ncbi:MAG TPA: CU044_2847 family protein [Blastocatellia bacterium]|nr:CU044_2847 family protein [Blastocatellia bacterium]HMV84414.1 CU044_2847 family protein [Blastocatellia bacterium]HMX30051.1 CU044_2847 family protein [Blastocatellia bacterium]HMY71257.1 CU044_2847 family protein [Blastocatellia bacterium]HMZ22373.1 CU044_2847 family protein [Blastocatellia bacterium]